VCYGTLPNCSSWQPCSHEDGQNKSPIVATCWHLTRFALGSLSTASVNIMGRTIKARVSKINLYGVAASDGMPPSFCQALRQIRGAFIQKSLVRTARLESPHVTTGDVTLDHGLLASWPLSRIAHLVDEQESELMCTTSGFFVPRLSNNRSRVESPMALGKCSSASFIETGGLGGLGLLAAAQILYSLRPCLSLLSRTRSIGPGSLLMQMMSAEGLVTLVSCDISKAHVMCNFFSCFSGLTGSVSGIVHAGGRSGGSTIPHE
jgi:hypothetical protein